jgi:holo-[acyl-carrier protein] synthase
MISGIGIDIVHVGRLTHWLEIPGLVERFFHPGEIEAVHSRGRGAALSLAARFAAKEAFGKALGSGLEGLKLCDIQVLNNHNGRPDMVLHGSAALRFQEAGGGLIHLSLTHDGENAVAVAIIEREPERA